MKSSRLTSCLVFPAFLGACLCFAPKVALGSRDFYLSTDRIFGPGDPVTVKLEAQYGGRLDVRVYRIPDPVEFLVSLEDPHRPKVGAQARRPSGVDLLAEAYRRTARDMFYEVRESLKPEGRKLARDGFGPVVKSFEEQAYSDTELAGVPPLRDFPLEMRFEELVPSAGGWVFQEIALPIHDPGAYLVEAVRGDQGAHTVVIISEIALLTRQGPRGMTTFVADRATGAPVAGASVRILDQGEVVAEGRTDREGLLEAEVKRSRTLVVAKRGESFAVNDPRYFPAMLNDRRAYLFTDRPVYRPGHQVYFKGFVRQRTETGYAIAQTATAKVHAIDPTGISLAVQEVSLQDGTFDGELELDQEARPGTYRLEALLGEEIYHGEFKVKAFKRPEFRVRVKTDKKAYRAGDTVTGQIEGQYFYGATMPGASLTYEVFRTRFYVPWWVDADYGWYYSEAEIRNTRRERVSQGEGKLDAEGRYAFSFPTDASSVDFTYAVEAYVTSESGRAIPGQGSLQVTRGAFHMELETDRLIASPGQSVSAQVTATDYAGTPMAGQAVTLRMFARSAGGDGKEVRHEYGEQQATTDQDGLASFDLKPDKRGLYSLEAQSVDRGGETIEAQGTLFISDDEGGLAYVPGSLEIVADRRTYSQGDTAQFLILTPFAEGHLLMSVEGTDLFQTRVVPITHYAAIYEVKIGPELMPNFFLGAASVFDGHYYAAQRSVVAPPADRFLEIAISSDSQTYEPGQKGTFTFEVKDKKGNPIKAALTVSIVDEKIYAISREVAVPIEQFFYPKSRNNVRSSSSLDFRFYGFSRDLTGETAMRPGAWQHAFGAAKDLSNKVRRNLVDTLAWSPRLMTDENGHATLSVTFPDNLTEWRVTARAITPDTRLGSATHSVTSRKDLVVEVAAPWTLRERDKAEVRVIARNYTNKTQILTLALEGEGVRVSGEARTIEVAPAAAATADFEVLATTAGMARLIGRANGEVEDALELTVPVFPYGIEEVETVAGDIPPGETTRSDIIALTLPAGATVQTASMNVRVTTGVASALISSLDYLVEYPHGCIEQTMSRFVPNLVAARALKDLGVQRPELEKKLPGYIAAGVSRLALFQQPDGGWGWWREASSDPYMTAHVMFGLATASRLGYSIPNEVFSRGRARLNTFSRQRNLDVNVKAYALYALALSGDPARSMIDRLAGARTLTPYGQALVALALSETGAGSRATEVAEGLVRNAAFDPERDQVHWARPAAGTYHWTRDPIETTATVVRSLIRTELGSEHVHRAVRWLMSQREDSHWRSTRDTAAVVYALADYLARAPRDYPVTTVKAMLNDTPVKEVSLSSDNLFQEDVLLLDWNRSIGPGVNMVRLDVSPGGGMFYSAALRYFTTASELKGKAGAFAVSRSYQVLRPSGKSGFAAGEDRDSVGLGELVLVRCKVKATRQAQPYVMVEDPIPGGLEVIEADSSYRVPGIKLRQPGVHREVYDDKVVFFTSRLSGSMTFAYVARAVRPGLYHAMPATATVMYMPDLTGHSGARKLEVSR